MRNIGVLFLFILFSTSLLYAQENGESVFDFNSKIETKKKEKLGESPYAIFGDNTIVLQTRHEEEKDHTLKIPIIENDEQKGVFTLDFQTGIVKILNTEGGIVFNKQLSEEDLARFVTVDPLAEKYYSWSPYAYVMNNPVRLIDPTGMYDIDAIQEKEKYGVIAVFQTNYENVDNGALEADIKAAKKAGIPVIYVDDIADLSDALKAIAGKGASSKTYTLNSHGSPGSFSIGSDKVTEKTDVSSLKNGLSGKNVFIGACRVAENEQGKELIQNFSGQTNSTVIAATHSISGGYSYDGSTNLNSIENRQTGFIRTIMNTLSGVNIGNTFRVARPGGNIQTVHNVTINSTGKVSWNSGNSNLLRAIQPSPLR